MKRMPWTKMTAMDEDDNDDDAKEDGEVLVSFMFGKRIKW